MRVAVVGGGITGLAAAHRLVELDRETGQGVEGVALSLLESQDRLGGHVRTERLGAYLVEAGPDTLVAHKPAALELCRRIGLEDEVVALGGPHMATEVVRRGRLVRVPDGFLMMGPGRLWPLLRSPLFSIRGKLRMLREPWIRALGPEDESLASFVTRRLGREALERAAEPIVAGLYTAKAEELSLRLTLPRFLEMERRHGSVVRALRDALRKKDGPRRGGLLAVRGGLGRIVEELAARLPAGSVRTGCAVETLRYDAGSSTWRLVCRSGPAVEADAVLLACPAHVSSRLLRHVDGELAASLRGLEYASCATLSLAYPRRAVGARLRSFGFFVPSSEGLPLLACSHVSLKFDGRGPADGVLFRAFLGGAAHPEILDLDDEALVERTHAALARLLRIEGRPVLTRLHRFPRSMPQYRVGQAAWIEDVRKRARAHPGLHFGGSTVGAIGLPDCIRSAEEAATAIWGQRARVGSRPFERRQAATLPVAL